MKILIIGLICTVSPFLSFGHNPLSARYHLDAGEHASLLTVNLSQDGINQALLKKYSKERLEEINQNELEALIVDYIKNNFNLTVGSQKIELKEGGIKLGSHQTDLKFVLPGFSKNVKRIEIHIPAFKENDHHQTIFSYNIIGRTEHVILSSFNNYQSRKVFASSGYTASWSWYILVGTLSLISIILLKMNHSTNELNFSIFRKLKT